MSKLSISLILLFVAGCFSASIKEKFVRETIDLPQPQREGGMNLYQAMTVRKSERDYDYYAEIPLDQLSQLLWAGYGVNRPDYKRTSASSHGVYPFDIYVFRADGTYKYVIEEGEEVKYKLEQVNNRDYRAITGEQDFVANAAVNIVLAGDLRKLDYAGDLKTKKIKCDLNSGHVLQNMQMYASSIGMKSVPRAMFIEAGILEVLGLSSENFYIPMTASFGY